jgi:hypothetical protein
VRAAEEAIAVEVCRQCAASGRDVTVPTIERVLQQLQAHRPACGCGLCAAAATVSADGVFGVVSSWQRSVRRRVRAVR